MGHRNANYAADDDESIPSVSNSDSISVVVSLFILMFGLWYYLRQSRRQRERLKAMDHETHVDQSNLL
jgi:ABC-type nickel/cobalt efflux system permease component RcnA